MNVLFIGDPHFQTNNIPDVELFLTSITSIASNRVPDIIVIAGDILHTHERIHTIALNKAYELVDAMRAIAPTYILVGNHDYTSNSQYLTDSHWMNGMKKWDNVYIIDRVLHEKLNGIDFVFVPYVFPGRFKEALGTSAFDWSGAGCIFAHQEFKGCKMGAIVSEIGDVWDLTSPTVVSGHIHSKQYPQPNIYYPGTPMQHAFGEASGNTVSYITFKSNSDFSINDVCLNLPTKKIMYMDVAGLEKYEPPTGPDKIRLTINGNYEEFKALKKTTKYKDIMAMGVKIVFKPDSLDPVIDADETISARPDGFEFEKILNDLINGKKDPYLVQAYDKIVLSRETDINDIFFV